MAAEVAQFVAALVALGVVAALWLRIVYVPRRTLENWEDRRPRPREKGRGSPGEGPASGEEAP